MATPNYQSEAFIIVFDEFLKLKGLAGFAAFHAAHAERVQHALRLADENKKRGVPAPKTQTQPGFEDDPNATDVDLCQLVHALADKVQRLENLRVPNGSYKTLGVAAEAQAELDNESPDEVPNFDTYPDTPEKR